MNGRASYLLRKRCFSKSQRCSTERKRTLLWSYLARICKTCCRSTGTSQLQMFGPKKLGIDTQLEHILWLLHRSVLTKHTAFGGRLWTSMTEWYWERLWLRGSEELQGTESVILIIGMLPNHWFVTIIEALKFVSLSNERILNWILLY